MQLKILKLPQDNTNRKDQGDKMQITQNYPKDIGCWD